MFNLNQKGFSPILLLLGVIIFLMVGGLSYFLLKPSASNPGFSDGQILNNTSSPVPQATVKLDQTQKINVYTSIKYGYMLSFPDNWKYTTNDEYLEAYENSNSGEKGSITMVVKVNSFNLSTPKTQIEKLTKDFTRMSGESYIEGKVNSKYTKLKNFQIDGYEGFLLKEYFTYEGPLYLLHYNIKLDNLTTLQIDFQSEKESVLDKNKIVIDQIINSIKIQPRSVTASEFKTYENKKYGFSFKYPGDWYVDDALESSNAEVLILRSSDGLGRLSLGLTLNAYSDGCEGVNLEENFVIGTQSVKLKDYCNRNNFLVQSQDGTEFRLATVAWGLLAEDTIKDVLKSVSGLKVVQ